MGNWLGRHHGRRVVREVTSSPEAVHPGALAHLSTVMFDPELRTAAQLVDMSPASKAALDNLAADDSAQRLNTAS